MKNEVFFSAAQSSGSTDDLSGTVLVQPYLATFTRLIGFDAQMQRASEQAALLFENQTLSYDELDRRANQLYFLG
jgi:non-ribosomal peptide synthetase component F